MAQRRGGDGCGFHGGTRGGFGHGGIVSGGVGHGGVAGGGFWHGGIIGGGIGRGGLVGGGFWPYTFAFHPYGYGLGYWPGYYDYDDSYPDASYPYGSGYPSHSSTPKVTVLYPEQTSPNMVYVERANPVIRDYDQYGQEVRPPSGSNASPIYLIATINQVDLDDNRAGAPTTTSQSYPTSVSLSA
jgi:hypothetical protein